MFFESKDLDWIIFWITENHCGPVALWRNSILSGADQISSVSADAGEQLCLSKGTEGPAAARS